ncbi:MULTISPECIES: glycosyltransferase [Microbacterium]|jgi:cellulose synthase/poly-beta-1,6-N-acetylglucosamine synthase-like glycosyltransferase|uniref:Glycosyltransferase, catalytic subunit of cellulose synthase and poly-beta-1,6-N-acetylglucosamine synthase n=1 Tax=Microbacterium testaceum (strain StLB037) TaxID=979556 RepID=A0A1H0RAB4_MICTS|nr:MULTISPECIES: glycosyltransferase family 2 protein [Microbacterium]KQM39922.1 glycosyl transferase [Microbacterium sp. Leaf203]MCY1716305.1 glycosyltransferase family 2 protein [Microbacterium sp. SL62]SDP25966.1 Glycosyltransferase, catalytic subunit of cellulose synthase and poly-beta-1,6-N-acetylglucosamine synthase [Microbacterium testaceum StLB037]
MTDARSFTPHTRDFDMHQGALEAAGEHGFADDFAAVLENTSVHRSTIGCVIPAYNEEESIADVIEALLAQTRVPDVIHVVVNNTSDATVKIASEFSGPHELHTELGEQFTEVFVHDIGKNPDKKVGALNYGYSLVEGYDYLLGVDGDTIADSKAVEYLETEAISDSRIGGISAIYTIDDKPIKGLVARFLTAGQRTQFAAFNLQNMLRGRNMAVLGGQFSIFSTNALRDAMKQNHQSTPWVKDSEVEDSLLSLQIKSAGYLTKISPYARADVGGMTTLSGYDAQQVKWTYGAIELMWPGQRGDTKGQPFHPNLRLRWFENFGMLTNLFVRVAFLTLLAGSLSIGAFVFSPLWLIPPVIAMLLNLRIARTMKNVDRTDVLFAVLFFPAEIFMWIRISHFVRSWTRFLSRKKVDNWAMQAKAERGGGLGHWTPMVVLVAVAIALAVIWVMVGPMVQSSILWIGWPIVGVVTVLQTLLMFSKLVRRHHGFKV